MVLPEFSEHSPSLVSLDDQLFLGWTGGSKKLNLAGPVGSTTGFGKRVYDAEVSDAGPALVRHGRNILIGWRGAGNLA